jgi:hypothetical protein
MMHEVPRLIVHADSPSTKERDPYARIRKMPEIRSVELSSAFSQAESPDTLDFSSFGASAADVQKTYATMYEWLATPFIEDTFTDHRDRRIWRQALSATDLALMRRNKFRNNLAGVVTALLQYLPQDVSSRVSMMAWSLNLVGRLPSTWRPLRRDQAFMWTQASRSLRTSSSEYGSPGGDFAFGLSTPSLTMCGSPSS